LSLPAATTPPWRALSDAWRENSRFSDSPPSHRRKMEKFAAPQLSILSALRPGRRCRQRHRLFPSRNRQPRRVSISRPVPPRCVLLRRHPIRRRHRLLRQQFLLSFLASAPMPILFIAGLLQRSSEIFGGVVAEFFLDRSGCCNFVTAR